MSEQVDFERAWLRKLSAGLDEVAGQEVRDQVLLGSESLSSESPREEVIDWTRDAMERLDSLVEEADRRVILTSCACQYPKAALQGAKHAYEETGDVALAHQMLQEQFEAFLRETLELDEEGVATIVDRGWGSAGVMEGSTIIATKIPKSGHLLDYLAETDPAKKRELYCHCPRVRDALRFSTSLSPTYCYCGAGFYKGIWEEILQQPVEVELLESVLQGDEVCKFSVHLPLND
jgi:predicted hydrocarbon binding protein